MGDIHNDWLFLPPASSNEDLYSLPVGHYQSDFPCPFPWYGCVIDLKTKMSQPINPPPKLSNIGGPYVVTVRGNIYLMACYDRRKSFFVCYNPVKDLWNTLEPFPGGNHLCYKRVILAMVVWDDTILINTDLRQIWAYDVQRNKWYPVRVRDNRCYGFFGMGIVIENAIYALSDRFFDSVMALSVERKQCGADIVFECSILKIFNVPNMGRVIYPNEEAYLCWSNRHLVHLGNFRFCIVQSSMFVGLLEYQPIQFTIIKLDGKKSTVIDKRFHNFKIIHSRQFEVGLCFSLLQKKTTAFEKEGFVLDLNKFVKEFASKLRFKDDPDATYEPVERNNLFFTDGSHSVYVRNLPPGVTYRQVENGLKKFGPIEKNWIKVWKNKDGMCHGYVKFESATSKQRAIEASTIKIGGVLAEILEKEEPDN